MNADSAWLDLLGKIIDYGSIVCPRDKNTRELIGVCTVINMEYPIVTISERNLGYRFMPAEAAWILSGDNRVETIKPYSNSIADYSDDGVYLHGPCK